MPDVDPLRIPASETSVLAISSGTVCFWLNTVVGRNALLAYDNRAVELELVAQGFIIADTTTHDHIDKAMLFSIGVNRCDASITDINSDFIQSSI